MEPPASLPSQLFLLAYDLDKNRMARTPYLGRTLRAAALTELYQAGRIRDADGKVRADPGRPGSAAHPSADPLLTAVLAQISATPRPRSWRRWVDRGERRAPGLIRDHLEAGRWIRVEHRALLGFIHIRRVTVRDPTMVRRLQQTVRRTLRGEISAQAIEPGPATLAALAAAGEFRTLASGRERRAARGHLAILAEAAGPAITPLRKAIRAAKSEHSVG